MVARYAPPTRGTSRAGATAVRALGVAFARVTSDVPLLDALGRDALPAGAVEPCA